LEAVLVIGTVIVLHDGLLKLSDFSSALPYAIIGASIGIFVWGFSRRIEALLETKAKSEALEDNLEVERVSLKEAISNEFSNIVYSLEPPREIVIPFHIKHIDYYLWKTKSKDKKIVLLGANDFGLLDNFYQSVDRWNDEASRRFQEIHNETVSLVKQAANVYEHVVWISSNKPDLEKVIARLRKRFGSISKTSGSQEAIQSLE
jgi:hypothetical protein